MNVIIRSIASQLETVYPADEAEALAWWVAEETSGLTRTQLQFGCKDTTFLRDTQEIIDRLLHFEPVQYIFGHTLWNGLDLKVTPATLIPRPETAELVEEIIKSKVESQKSKVRVLDIGTGSGCIAIALKKNRPEWEVTGIDISAEAIGVARENAVRNNVEVNFLVADILSDETEGNDQIVHDQMVNIVVSNPPYIRESEKSSMKPNVLDYEPSSALFVPDDDPLRFYRRIASLQLGRYLFFEINENLSDETGDLLRSLGYTDIRLSHDIYGKPRIIQAQIPEDGTASPE
ncbi:MAG: peptide chain release factor N(5)-glutamine methyltransferase [Paludibacteraceae bacterium]|nr:peptide chain release factor N(5)-glutamine methyltransferase [Paludibacteraceae bacterium]